MCVFFTLRHFFLFRPRSFLVLSAPWHAGSRPDTKYDTKTNAQWKMQVWALAEVRGTCSWGSKWQVPTGSDSEHVGPSRPMKPTYRLKECPTAHVQVKGMSDGSCDIRDLECRQCRQTLLGDGNVTIMPDGSYTG